MKSRRGISSVVGTVFAIIALGTTIGYITYSMTTVDNYSQTVLTRIQQTLDVAKEKFSVDNVAIVNNKLHINVTNTGSLPINFTKVWVTNSSSLTTWVNSYVPVNAVIPPAATITNLGQSLPVYINTANQYHIKLVTSRGNTNEFNIGPAITQPLDIKLYAFPKNLVSGFTTTLLMTVTNNMSNKMTLVNITPASLSPGDGIASYTIVNGPVPTTYDTLPYGSTATFTWDVSVTGDPGNYRTFTASLQNGYLNNQASVTVTVTAVPFSLQSNTVVSSMGLTSASHASSILELHKETTDTPNGAYQMWNGSPEPNAATTIDTNSATRTWTWFTNNDTVSQVHIPPGTWNLLLRYASALAPNGLPTPVDLMYHFENVGNTKDSSGFGEDLTANGSPSFAIYTGVNNTGAFTLSGSGQYLNRAVDQTHNNGGTTSASTAGWFKATSAVGSSKQPIIRIGDSSGKPFYEIGLAANTGKVYFSFTGSNNGGSVVTCQTNNRYDNDGKWHHFTAVKTSWAGCTLYVDQETVSNIQTCSGNCNNAIANNGNNFNIGKDPSTNTYFVGTIDDVIHWNSGQFTSAAQVSKLLAQCYCSTAHHMSVTVQETDYTGNPIYTLNSSPVTFPYFDGVLDQSHQGYNYYTNYTFTTSNWYNFTNNQRLKLSITDTSGMNMTIRIDDANLYGLGTSFLQSPTVDNALPGYLTYSKSTYPIFYFQEIGPASSWVSFLTRLSFNDQQSTDSYGSLATFANGTALNPYRDALLVKAGQLGKLQFSYPTNPPCNVVPNNEGCASVTSIPTGTYRLYAFLSGYDDLGNIFLRTIYVGNVKVTP